VFLLENFVILSEAKDLSGIIKIAPELSRDSSVVSLPQNDRRFVILSEAKDLSRIMKRFFVVPPQNDNFSRKANDYTKDTTT
jgi:hypothetical protein